MGSQLETQQLQRRGCLRSDRVEREKTGFHACRVAYSARLYNLKLDIVHSSALIEFCAHAASNGYINGIMVMLSRSANGRDRC